MSGETIAAQATAPGPSGVAVVRVSGPDAFSIAERLTGWTPTAPFPCCRTRFVRAASSVVDRAVILAFRAPRSYTGEDVVEFQTHGGRVTPRRVLDAILGAGARLARRGEFTQRAFLNGKLSLDQAESVLDLVCAKTVRAADAALEGLAGRRSSDLADLYRQTLDLSAEFEHALDIDEGDLPEDFRPRVSARLADLRAAFAAHLARANEGRLLRTGAAVVLAGAPNAGKSSLMNALLETNRAIVSDTPGTTRDAIEEELDLDGWPVRLIDTAGLRETENAIEAEGVRRAEDLIARADVILQVRDLSAAAPAAFPTCAGDERLICVATKADLFASGERPVREGEIALSSKTGEGLAALKTAIVEKLRARAAHLTFAESPADGSERHRAVLFETAARLPCACEDLVLTANALRRAATHLGSALGATYTDDLLTNLFSRFCVGK